MGKDKNTEKKAPVLIPANKDTLMSWFHLPADVDPTTLSKFISEVVSGFSDDPDKIKEETVEKNFFSEMKKELRDVVCYSFLQYQKIAKLEETEKKAAKEKAEENELLG